MIAYEQEGHSLSEHCPIDQNCGQEIRSWLLGKLWQRVLLQLRDTGSNYTALFPIPFVARGPQLKTGQKYNAINKYH